MEVIIPNGYSLHFTIFVIVGHMNLITPPPPQHLGACRRLNSLKEYFFNYFSMLPYLRSLKGTYKFFY